MKEIHLGIGDGGRGLVGVLFHGEVAAADLIDGTSLAASFNLREGIVYGGEEVWLHFELDGVTLYVSKKPLRYDLTKNTLKQRGVITGGNTVEINGKNYKVRLLKGASGDKVASTSSGNDLTTTHGSEWNRLFYPLVTEPNNAPNFPISREGIVFGSLANYSEADLGMLTTNGGQSICQESTSYGYNTVVRGYMGVVRVSGVSDSLPSYSNRNRLGWRPVLELVE